MNRLPKLLLLIAIASTFLLNACRQKGFDEYFDQFEGTWYLANLLDPNKGSDIFKRDSTWVYEFKANGRAVRSFYGKKKGSGKYLFDETEPETFINIMDVRYQYRITPLELYIYEADNDDAIRYTYKK